MDFLLSLLTLHLRCVMIFVVIDNKIYMVPYARN